jgi:hypothetical protein
MRTIHANKGYGFPKPGRATQVRDRSKIDVYLAVIDAELKRCGVHTRKVKIRKFSGILYLNIFYLRGLDPDFALTNLKQLPNYCGVKRVISELSQLEERVESGQQRILEAIG